MSRFLALAMGLLLTGSAFAQTAGVPPEELNNTRRLGGDRINVCFDRTSLGRPFDQDVAQAIADALFLEMEVVEGFGGFPLNGDGFLDELTLAMNNTCDVFMGVTVSANSPFSEAFALTRPYATIPFVLAVSDPDYQSLGDIPKDRPLGTAMASMGEMNYIMWAQQQPEGESWIRYPYPDANKMTTRVLDGTIAGMLVWQPTLARLRAEREDAADLRIVDIAPAPEASVSVGALVSSRNSFLRSQMDEAIAALVADGTIDALLAEHGYEGRAGE